MAAKLARYDRKTRKVNKADANGRILDIHGLRHTYCSMIARSGVNQQTAQKLMRHATPAMTARYTHLNLHDLGGAMASLPPLPEPKRNAAAIAQTGHNLRPTQRPHFSRTEVQKHALSCTVEDRSLGSREGAKRGEKPSICGENDVVGEEGVEPSIRHRQRILSPPCMPFHHSPGIGCYGRRITQSGGRRA